MCILISMIVITPKQNDCYLQRGQVTVAKQKETNHQVKSNERAEKLKPKETKGKARERTRRDWLRWYFGFRRTGKRWKKKRFKAGFRAPFIFQVSFFSPFLFFFFLGLLNMCPFALSFIFTLFIEAIIITKSLRIHQSQIKVFLLSLLAMSTLFTMNLNVNIILICFTTLRGQLSTRLCVKCSQPNAIWIISVTTFKPKASFSLFTTSIEPSKKVKDLNWKLASLV